MMVSEAQLPVKSARVAMYILHSTLAGRKHLLPFQANS